jgi:gamma-glutamyltranspeptidase/glutathione hydrolase
VGGAHFHPVRRPHGARDSPNGQGIAALIALGILEQLPYRDTAPGSAARMHLEIEAMRLAFADLYAHIADPAHMEVTPPSCWRRPTSSAAQR